MENFSEKFVEKLKDDKTIMWFLLGQEVSFSQQHFKIEKVPSDQMECYKASLELCLEYKGGMALFEGMEAKLDIGICDTEEFSTDEITDILKKNDGYMEFNIYSGSPSNPLYKLSTTLNDDGKIEASQKFLQQTYLTL